MITSSGIRKGLGESTEAEGKQRKRASCPNAWGAPHPISYRVEPGVSEPVIPEPGVSHNKMGGPGWQMREPAGVNGGKARERGGEESGRHRWAPTLPGSLQNIKHPSGGPKRVCCGHAIGKSSSPSIRDQRRRVSQGRRKQQDAPESPYSEVIHQGEANNQQRARLARHPQSSDKDSPNPCGTKFRATLRRPATRHISPRNRGIRLPLLRCTSCVVVHVHM